MCTDGLWVRNFLCCVWVYAPCQGEKIVWRGAGRNSLPAIQSDGPDVSYHQTYSARDRLSIPRTPYPTQNLQRKHRKTYNTLVLPTFLYGSENWTLTALQRRRIEEAEMKSLRPLADYTLYDHKTNDYIRHELRITGILDKTDEYRRKWLSHLQRMPQNRIPLKSYHYRPQGRRTIGRPKKRWREQL